MTGHRIYQLVKYSLYILFIGAVISAIYSLIVYINGPKINKKLVEDYNALLTKFQTTLKTSTVAYIYVGKQTEQMPVVAIFRTANGEYTTVKEPKFKKSNEGTGRSICYKLDNIDCKDYADESNKSKTEVECYPCTPNPKLFVNGKTGTIDITSFVDTTDSNRLYLREISINFGSGTNFEVYTYDEQIESKVSNILQGKSTEEKTLISPVIKIEQAKPDTVYKIISNLAGKYMATIDQSISKEELHSLLTKDSLQEIFGDNRPMFYDDSSVKSIFDQPVKKNAFSGSILNWMGI
jgi:hypothetical protein